MTKKLTLALSILLIPYLIVLSCKPSRKVSQPPTKEELAEPPKYVLRSPLAGRWYTSDTNELRGQIDAFYKRASSEPADDVIALILPHAGYTFSGQTATWGLKTIKKQYKRIIIIGPSHSLYMEEVLSSPKVTHYETLFGQIPLDRTSIETLLGYPLFQNIPKAHTVEHSIQIHLPLLQYLQKDFNLVPVIAGNCSQQTIEKAGSILSSLIDNQTLVIASSDFVHYGPNYNYVPFTENIPQEIKTLDMGAFEFIEKLDYKGFLDYCNRTGATICGYVPIAILLSMLPETTKTTLASYTTSGEITGDFKNSVSYLSVVFNGSWQTRQPKEPHQQQGNFELTQAEKNLLLKLARDAITQFLQERKVPTASEATLTDTIKRPRAAFVTLKKNSHLRGCIGDVFPRQPLYKSVISNAINAAVNDGRFPPLQESELSDITIEVSVLTVPQPVKSPNDIRIGIDGMILTKNGHSALFLPHVATEQGWGLAETLSNLSLKAGLEADAWKQNASFEVYQATIFSEQQK